MDTLELVGRGRQLALLAELIDDARRGRAQAVALVGEPGIGKSALLETAARSAAVQGLRVLRAAGSGPERDFPYACLMALLRPVRHALDDLPPAQRDALRGVLSGETAAIERFVVGAGALAAFARAAEREPLVLVVDDLQWVDEPTQDVLAFVLRRFDADAVATLVAARPGGLGELAGVVDAVHEVPPLEAGAARALLETAGPSLDPAVGEWLLDASHGNPLALLELPHRLSAEQQAGLELLPPALVAGQLVEQAFAGSAAALPEETRLALAVAAMLEEGAGQTLRAALQELGCTPYDLEPAEEAGLVALSPGRFAFRHPLVRAAVLRAAGGTERRRAHLAIAGALPRGEARALHLAEATVGPDAVASAALEEAAAEAPAVTASALLARAADLAPNVVGRARLLADAAAQALHAGRLGPAGRLAGDALALDPPAAVCAVALVVQGGIARATAAPTEACALLEHAATLLATSDPGRATEILGEAVLASLPAGDPGLTLPLAERFLAQSAAVKGRFGSLERLLRGIARQMAGRGREGTEELCALLERDAGDEVGEAELRLVAALWLPDYERAHVEAGHAIAELRSAGRLWALPRVLVFAGFAEARLGRFPAAYAAVSESAAMAQELGQTVVWCDAGGVAAGLEARLGLHERCRARSEEVIRVSRELGLDWYANHATFQLALSELAEGRADRVVELLEPPHQANRERAVADPGEYQLSDLVEAYVLLGDLGRGAECLAELERLLEQVERPFDRALATRSAAMLASDEEAPALFERSLAEHTAEMPFEVARTRLLFGERLRRMGERRRARGELRAADALFASLGADWWRERCRRELVASGARLRRVEAGNRDELTPQELQVALEVARGHTNREIAQTLFLSPKTVEFHLTRIYRKLELHARAELRERFREQVEPHM